MQNKWIKVLMVLIALVIAAMVVADYLSTRVDKRPANPFAYSVEEYEKVDESLISYRETRQIRTGDLEMLAMAWGNGRIFVLTDEYLQVITPLGQEISRTQVEPGGRCIALSPDGTVMLGYENHLVALRNEEEVFRSQPAAGDALFTALAVSEDLVFVADAGNRQVITYDHELQQTGSFKGESGVSALHGLILPSMHFDLGVNAGNELWVVNPGLHSIQNYTPAGRLRGHWSKSSFGPDGFSGCCNPYFIAFLSDGRFVTSEKGIIRVKIHKESGEFESFVAAPEKFGDGTRAPALAVDGNDHILLLDFDNNMIRYFEPN
jgi:hypothetical protein